MKYITIIFMLITLNSIGTEYGYQISIECKNKVTRHNVFTVDQANTILQNNGIKINLAELLESSNFVEVRNEFIFVYVEKKIIVRSKGRIKFKQIKRKK